MLNSVSRRTIWSARILTLVLAAGTLSGAQFSIAAFDELQSNAASQNGKPRVDAGLLGGSAGNTLIGGDPRLLGVRDEVAEFVPATAADPLLTASLTAPAKPEPPAPNKAILRPNPVRTQIAQSTPLNIKIGLTPAARPTRD